MVRQKTRPRKSHEEHLHWLLADFERLYVRKCKKTDEKVDIDIRIPRYQFRKELKVKYYNRRPPWDIYLKARNRNIKPWYWFMHDKVVEDWSFAQLGAMIKQLCPEYTDRIDELLEKESNEDLKKQKKLAVEVLQGFKGGEPLPSNDDYSSDMFLKQIVNFVVAEDIAPVLAKKAQDDRAEDIQWLRDAKLVVASRDEKPFE